MRKSFHIFGITVFLLVLALGWKYPLLAYCMVLNVAGGLFFAFTHGGRSGCGTFCPRGMFYSALPDTKRPLPALLRHRPFALFVPLLFAALIVLLRPAGWLHWGLVFYWMIAATTLVGMAGALVFNRFFWCAICPMGRFYRKIGSKTHRLQVADSCVNCGKCRTVCPFSLNIPGAKGGALADMDCIHCRRCVEACPKRALTFR